MGDLEITFSLFMQHFLHNEPVVGIEYEAQLQKTLLPRELIYLLLFSFDIKFPDKSSLGGLIIEVILVIYINIRGL